MWKGEENGLHQLALGARTDYAEKPAGMSVASSSPTTMFRGDSNGAIILVLFFFFFFLSVLFSLYEMDCSVYNILHLGRMAAFGSKALTEGGCGISQCEWAAWSGQSSTVMELEAMFY